MERVLKAIYHRDRNRRVLIVERSNGHYGCQEEKFSDDARENCWLPKSQKPFSIRDSADTAEYEARH